uniref:G_PROTEIN_RECEP_F1_2 domain-containing protein n=1 Tax=Steinernema glaseri TaxID=37863 RepID=A0A1I7Y6Z3_9BILA
MVDFVGMLNVSIVLSALPTNILLAWAMWVTRKPVDSWTFQFMFQLTLVHIVSTFTPLSEMAVNLFNIHLGPVLCKGSLILFSVMSLLQPWLSCALAFKRMAYITDVKCFKGLAVNLALLLGGYLLAAAVIICQIILYFPAKCGYSKNTHVFGIDIPEKQSDWFSTGTFVRIVVYYITLTALLLCYTIPALKSRLRGIDRVPSLRRLEFIIRLIFMETAFWTVLHILSCLPKSMSKHTAAHVVPVYNEMQYVKPTAYFVLNLTFNRDVRAQIFGLPRKLMALFCRCCD